MQTQRTLAGGNGNHKDRTAVNEAEAKLRDHQGLPEPHNGRLAVVGKKEEAPKFSLSSYQAFILFVVVQTFGFVWFLSGLNAQVIQLTKDNADLRVKADMNEAKIYTLTVKFAEYKGASAFARFMDAAREEDDQNTAKKKEK